MLEDLREQAETGSLFDELEDDDYQTESGTSPLSQDVILGMTAIQRFIIAVLLLMVTCLMSALCLLATGKVVPPFLF